MGTSAVVKVLVFAGLLMLKIDLKSKFLHQLMCKFLKGVLKFTLKQLQHISM